MKTLSIVTPTTHSRKPYLDEVMRVLTPQLTSEVEHIILVDGGELTLGRKMNTLYSLVSGKYVTVLNDDDMIPGNYVELILGGAKLDKDIILGKIKTGWVAKGGSTLDYNGDIIHNYENVLPAKTELVRKYCVWDEGFDNQYMQDSSMARRLEASTASIYRMNEILYYHMRRR